MKTLVFYLPIILMLGTVSSRDVRAQDTTGRSAAAWDLITTMKLGENMTRTIDVMIKSQVTANPAMEPYEEVLRRFLAKYISMEYLGERFVAIYANEFTTDELHEIDRFYRTDVGRKAVEKLPMLMAKGAEIGQQAVRDHQAELTEAIEQRRRELNLEK
jgi:uncharacterized protein